MKYDSAKKILEISVGELCFLSHRSRDLDFSRSHRAFAELQSGSSAHRALGKYLAALCKDSYFTEQVLSVDYGYCGFTFRVSGRADGVIVSSDGALPIGVDEYKSTVSPESKKPNPSHKAQLCCYALMLMEKHDLKSISARLIYCKRDFSDQCMTAEADNAFKAHSYEITLSEAAAALERMLDFALWYVRHEELRQTEILPAARSIPFPYPTLREGQSELIRECYRCIKGGKRLFAQAPTGIGKTVSVLYPAVRALSDGYCDKIFYLTAKSSTRKEAHNAAGKLFSVGAHIRTVVLSAKSFMCRDPMRCASRADTPRCDPKYCVYARGYNACAKQAIDELLSTQNCFTSGVIIKIAERYKICPYELSLDLSELCDLIICDYNYVFDPAVYLRRYFSENPTHSGRFVFLADEAHNLPERVRDMYSAQLSSKELKSILALIPEEAPKLGEAVKLLIDKMYALEALCHDELTKDADGKNCGFWLDRNLYIPFADAVSAAKSACDKVRCAVADSNDQNGVFRLSERLCAMLGDYLRIADIFSDGFLNCVEFDHGDVTVKLYCLDPSEVIDKCLSKAVSSIMFSATLTPPDYFADLLGSSGRASVTLTLPSPFPKENLCVVAAVSVSTRYDDREASVKKIANYIALTVSHKIGNYIVYFPSYKYMAEVLKVFSAKYPEVPLLVQQPEMSPEDRRAFIDSFPEDTGKLRVGFCVLGGSFSEGVDLPGTRLIGTVIVGVGLPGLSNERNIMRDYFQNKYERGYDYAYTYPGMNNVLQAAGRVIRTENDRGVVVLIDDRYQTPLYRELLPETFSHIKYATTPREASDCIRRFWRQK